MAEQSAESATSHIGVWMRRLWLPFCLLSILVTYGFALYDPYGIDGDAVAYMDIGDLIRSHHWAGIVNGYWNPLYPAALALGHHLFHATRFTELHAYYMVNFGIFLLEMLAVVLFTDSLVALRTQRSYDNDDDIEESRFLMGLYSLRYIGVGLLLIATQRELGLGKVRPDALLQALLLFALAFLIRHLASRSLAWAGMMGFVLGLAYLTKSFAFLFSLLCILALVLFRWLWQQDAFWRVVLSGCVALVCFAAVAGPYIAALSRSKGHFDFGDSGALNYAWYVGGTEKMHLQPWQTTQFGSAEVHLKHPEKELMRQPPIFSYRQMPYGTYPDWFDTTFWNDSVKPHNTLKGDLTRGRRNAALVVRYLLNHPEGWILLLLFLLCGARLALGWGVWANAFWFVPLMLGLCIWGIYSIVNVEERYVTIGFLSILLPLFATLSFKSDSGYSSSLSIRPTNATTGTAGQPSWLLNLAPALALLFALQSLGGSARLVLDQRRNLPQSYPGGWYDPTTFHAAQQLNAMGIGPGDTVACIGYHACLNDHYWARVAGVRILTEIYDPEGDVYTYLNALPNRDAALATVGGQGDKALIGYFEQPGEMNGSSTVSAGWQQLAGTPLYLYPLTPQSVSVPSSKP